MLKKLSVTGGACFGDSPLELENFERVNFFFGANGSGKTTISRALAGYGSLSVQSTWSDGSPLKVRVYNRDFVDRILLESDRIPGVFVVGKSNADAERRLQAIEGKGGERAAAQGELTKASKSLETTKQSNEQAKATFQSTAWASFQKLIKDHPSVEPAFKGKGGVGNSKQLLMERLLKLPVVTTPVPTIESLTKDAEAVFDAGSVACGELPKTPSFELSQRAGYALLSERVVGSDEVSLSELVTMLGNSDWVSDGRQYVEAANGRCPFCQQATPHDFVSELAALFDDEYSEKKQHVEKLVSDYESWSESVSNSLSDFDSDARSFLDAAAYNASMVQLRTEIDKNLTALQSKKQNPSLQVTLTDLQPAIEALDAHIVTANAAIKAHNALISGRQTERPKLVARCWDYLAREELGSVISTFRKQQAGRDKAVDALESQAEAAQGKIDELDEEVRTLRSSVRSTQPVIDNINALLARNGFTSFQIVPSDDLKDGYMLARDNGAADEHSLSEGERTFIAFLYYFHLLDEQPADDGESHRTMAIIDDPVSSLDSDVLFVVGALVRRIIARAFEATDHIEQVLVLTHNVYFHKDVSHVRQGVSPTDGRTYYVVRKRHGEASEVLHHRFNPVTTEYRRLWGEIKRAMNGEEMNIVGLENIMRRILETYFRVMGGGIWDDDITPHLEQAEQHVFQALFRWSNEGSHSILEEAFYTPTPITQDVYLNVFRRVFEVTNQIAHYEMMVDGKGSLPQPADSTSDNLQPGTSAAQH